MSQFTLLKRSRFAPLFSTQFLGAFNDNLYKNALVTLVTFGAINQSEVSVDLLVNLAAGLFILPFFLFSASAGQLADKLDKAKLIRRIKLVEIIVMLIAAVGFLVLGHIFLIFVLFLMGAQSTFFGPVKYAILPQHLEEHELVGGNALIETGTFVAILLGTLLGPLVQSLGAVPISVCLVLVAVAGWISSRSIPPAAPTDPDLKIDYNPLTATAPIIAFARGNTTVFNSILAISWFWLYGSVFITQMPRLAQEHLGGNVEVFQVLVFTFVAGIAVGSLLCECLSGKMVEIGLVPVGAAGLSLFAFDLYFAVPPATGADLVGAIEFLHREGSWRVCLDLAGIALFGGFFIVPLYALIQIRSDPAHRSRIIAANNILNAAFMVAAALSAILLLGAGLSVTELFAVMAAMNVAVACYIFKLVPEFLMRFLVWALVRSVYRLRVHGLENIPDSGPCVLACNHVSFVDALIVTAACRRPIRFVMDHKIYAMPVLNFVFRTTRAIPIAPRRENAELMDQAFETVAEALERGEVVGIFPEGVITRTPEMNPFREGIVKIVARTPVPVVPLALVGLWGSFFSRKDGSAMSHPMRLITRFASNIELRVGTAIAGQDVRAESLARIVEELKGRAV